MNYSEILKKAWNIVWKHKILWLFGFLAGSAVGGSQGFSYQFSSRDRLMRHWGDGGGKYFPMFERLSESLHDVPSYTWFLLAAGIAISVLLVSLIAFFLREYGVGGVIKGSALAEEQENGKLNFKALHHALKPFYWRLILLRLLVAIASVLLAGLLAVPVVIFIIGTLGVGLCCLLPFLILLIPVGWAARVLVHNASIALVDENLDPLQAIERAWELSTQNLGPLLVLHIILGLIRLVCGLVLSVPLIAAALPLIFALRASAPGISAAAGLVSALLWLLLLPLLLIAFGVLNAYDLTARALAYRELKEKTRVVPIGTQALTTEATK